MKTLLSFASFLCAISLFSQRIDWQFMNQDKPFSKNEYIILEGDSIKITKFQFYISNVTLHNEKTSHAEVNSYHLIDAFNPSSKSIKLSKSLEEFQQISFTFGIDSVTNYNGAQGGDLDPLKGMYWTWRTGYINCKIEGEMENQTFFIHLGGFQGKEKSAQNINLKLSDNQESVEIKIDIHDWIKAIDLKKNKHIMSPGQNAVMISKQLAKHFSIQ